MNAYMTREDFTSSLHFKTSDAAVYMSDALRFEDVLIRPIQHIVRHRMYLESLAKVSVLLCTVTLYANLAHSLTRSP
jgi:hypothetical protein